MKAIWLVMRLLLALLRWKRGVVPSIRDRRLIIWVIETGDAQFRSALDHVFGPTLGQAVADKTRRRIMAVVKVRSEMDAQERLEMAMRGVINALNAGYFRRRHGLL